MTAKEIQVDEGGEVSELTIEIGSEIKSEVADQELRQEVYQEVHQETSESAATVKNEMENPHCRMEVCDLLIDHDSDVIDFIISSKEVVNGVVNSEVAVQEPSQGVYHEESATPIENELGELRDLMEIDVLSDLESDVIDVITPMEFEMRKPILEVAETVDQETEEPTKQADVEVEESILPVYNGVVRSNIKTESEMSMSPVDSRILDFEALLNDIKLDALQLTKSGDDSTTKKTVCESFSYEYLKDKDSTPFEPTIKGLPAGLKEKPYTVKIRGMRNTSNACYIISTLQALFNCPAFAGLMHYACHLNESVLNDKTLPFVTSMVNMFSQVEHRSPRPISPKYIKRVLQRVAGERYSYGQQEDADELLGVILNKLHDEEVAVVKNGDRSCVSDLFRGDMSYFNLNEDGKITQSDSPFYSLPLSIEDKEVKNVQKALDHTFGISKKDESEKILLKKLPKTLIVQLKCFTYHDYVGSKVIKRFRVNKILKITSEHLNREARENYSENIKYRIRAVIFHRGYLVNAGHYIVNVFKNDEWICLDDETSNKTEEKVALSSVKNLMPYILFYELCSEDETESDVEVDEEEDEEFPELDSRRLLMPESLRRKTRERHNLSYPRWDMYERERRHRNKFDSLRDLFRDDESDEGSDTDNEMKRLSPNWYINDEYERMRSITSGRSSFRPPKLHDLDDVRPNYSRLAKTENNLRKKNLRTDKRKNS